jgi:hypothetical protein
MSEVDEALKAAEESIGESSEAFATAAEEAAVAAAKVEEAAIKSEATTNNALKTAIESATKEDVEQLSENALTDIKNDLNENMSKIKEKLTEIQGKVDGYLKEAKESIAKGKEGAPAAEEALQSAKTSGLGLKGAVAKVLKYSAAGVFATFMLRDFLSKYNHEYQVLSIEKDTTNNLYVFTVETSDSFNPSDKFDIKDNNKPNKGQCSFLNNTSLLSNIETVNVKGSKITFSPDNLTGLKDHIDPYITCINNNKSQDKTIPLVIICHPDLAGSLIHSTGEEGASWIKDASDAASGIVAAGSKGIDNIISNTGLGNIFGIIKWVLVALAVIIPIIMLFWIYKSFK